MINNIIFRASWGGGCSSRLVRWLWTIWPIGSPPLCRHAWKMAADGISVRAVFWTYRRPDVMVVVWIDGRINWQSSLGLGRSWRRTGRLVGRVVPLKPLTSSHLYDMPVWWSHLSTADYHLVRLSSTTSCWICLFRSLSVSSTGLRSRSSESDLVDEGRVSWKL